MEPNPPNAADGRPALHRLSAAFAAEPELISACLEGPQQRSADWARTVLAAAELALRQRPHYADLNYHASRAAVAASQFETAARLLVRALCVNPTYHDALVLAARVELQRGRAASATRYLETALTCGADYPDVYLLLGRARQEDHNWAGARQAFEKALELNAGLQEAQAALAALPRPQFGRPGNELPA
jgi:tetratricopeptide (TPR) repeat protein